MSKYVDLFVEYLCGEDCKYPRQYVIKNTYRYGGKDYDKVEVLSGEAIIQAFVLMSKEHCESLDKFPFYRTYFQRNEYGYVVPPACYVAVYDESNDKWRIHSANDLRKELRRPDFLNYDEAVKRFDERFGFIGNVKLWNSVKRLSLGLLCVIVMYTLAHFLSINGLLGGITLPLDATVVSIFVILMCLLLIPPFIPYIRSLTVGNVGIELRDSNYSKGK